MSRTTILSGINLVFTVTGWISAIMAQWSPKVLSLALIAITVAGVLIQRKIERE